MPSSWSWAWRARTRREARGGLRLLQACLPDREVRLGLGDGLDELVVVDPGDHLPVLDGSPMSTERRSTFPATRGATTTSAEASRVPVKTRRSVRGPTWIWATSTGAERFPPPSPVAAPGDAWGRSPQ